MARIATYMAFIISAFVLGPLMPRSASILGDLYEYFDCWFLSYSSDADKAVSDDVVLYSHFTPLDLDTVEKDMKDITISMRGLLEWQRPHRTNITLKASDFMPMLPTSNTGVGDMWYMVQPIDYYDEEVLANSLSMRYKDVAPQNNTAASMLYHVLSMFHINTFLQTRFAPRGTVATLRAQNSDYLNIVFRCHAEFQLNNPPLFPFWFTPAQFQGELIMTRNSSKVIKFIIQVPTNRKLNVDMEWINSLHENMEVDIGFIPLMVIQIPEQNFIVSWDEEISMQEAYELLEKQMFPFKEVAYKPIEEAITDLSQQQKPLHCIVLWGALDDQSC